MAVTASVTLSPKERVVQEALEARLEPNELLLGFTLAHHNPGGMSAQVYYMGLTQRRFLLVPKDEVFRVYSLYRPFIKEVSFNNSGLFKRHGLKISLGKEGLSLATNGVWYQRAGQMAQEFARLLDIPLGLTATQVLGQVNDLLDLGQLGAADELLRERMSSDPVIEIAPGAAEMSRLIRDARLALRVGAGIFGVVLVFMLALAVLGMAKVGLGILLAFLAIAGLVRGQQGQRGLALTLALLTAGLNGALGLAVGSLADVGLWLSFAVAMVLTLTGRPTRQRILLAVLIFVVGFCGALAFVALGGPPSLNGAAMNGTTMNGTGMNGTAMNGTAMNGTVSPQAMALMSEAHAAADYQDDFNANRGWAVRTHPDLTSDVVNGAYAVQVRQPSATFFTFPPVRFVPTAAEFDATVPETFTQAVGTFGITCDYAAESAAAGAVTPEIGQAYYLVEIAPARQQFAILKQSGEAVTSLLDPAWQPITGLLASNSQMHVSVTCVAGEIRLAINSVDQARAAMSGPTGGGRMGLFVSTWKDSSPDGYKVLFDNARFWKLE